MVTQRFLVPHFLVRVRVGQPPKSHLITSWLFLVYITTQHLQNINPITHIWFLNIALAPQLYLPLSPATTARVLWNIYILSTRNKKEEWGGKQCRDETVSSKIESTPRRNLQKNQKSQLFENNYAPPHAGAAHSAFCIESRRSNWKLMTDNWKLFLPPLSQMTHETLLFHLATMTPEKFVCLYVFLCSYV